MVPSKFSPTLPNEARSISDEGKTSGMALDDAIALRQSLSAQAVA